MYYLTEESEANLKATPKVRYLHNSRALALLKELQLTNATPTSEQKEILASFNGWGALSQVFNLNPEGWAGIAQKELKNILTPDEYRQASESIINAHYTEPSIIRAIWKLVQRMGFSGGRVLEPGCGTGLFYSCMPTEIRSNSQLFGVELDAVPAAIARHLHSDATIYNQGFETASFPDGYFDLAIGNVPFGSYKLNDPHYNHLGLSIHNYFFAKACDLVRPGGLIAFVTSTYTLDAQKNEFREWLAERCRLVEAIRLPSGTMKEIANTEVSTDILVFQRLDKNIERNDTEWVETKEIYIAPGQWTDKETAKLRPKGVARLNDWYNWEFDTRSTTNEYQQLYDRYSSTYPQQAEYYKSKIFSGTRRLLGIPIINELYGEGFALLADSGDIEEEITNIPVNKTYCPGKPKEFAGIILPRELQDTKDLAFCTFAGNIYQRRGSQIHPVEIESARVTSFWDLRSHLLLLIDAQKSADNETLVQQQKALKQTYQQFTQKWGKINSKQNIKLLGEDPNYYLLRTLEVDNKEKLADIFSKRVCRTQTYAHATTPQDALVHSLNNYGKLNLPYMAQLLGVSEEKVVKDLSAAATIYYNPVTEEWELISHYLSGNVYNKLKEAQTAGLSKNIAALKEVLPQPMLPDADDQTKLACLTALNIDWSSLDEQGRSRLLGKLIKIKLGSSWVNSKYYVQFANEVLQIRVKIRRLGGNVASWVVSGNSGDTTEYGTPYLDSKEILQNVLNGVDPRVQIYDHDKKVDANRTAEASEEARVKCQAQKQAFLEWVWEDQQRATELCLYYNTNVNVFVERTYDGSWLQLPGSNPDISLNWWQKNAIARIIEDKATFLAHDVGIGKTYTMITAIMECRRLGLARKPIMVVLNGTEKQVEADWKKLYPMANLLVPQKLDAEGRKLFTAALATADFDGAIITHSQFLMMAMSGKYQLKFLNQEKKVVQDLLEELKSDRGSTKELQKALRNVEARIKKVVESQRKDKHIEFEGLCDMLVLDEIHKFKNLSVYTKLTRVRGIRSGYSQRATDSYMKILHTLGDMIGEAAGEKGKVVGATGTILSNTMAELYTWSRMFQLPSLVGLGVEAFDSWVSHFGEIEASPEISPSGQYKVITRLKNFGNLQVLRSLMGEFVDIMTGDMCGNDLDRPKATYIDIITPPSDAQLGFLRDALERSERIRDRLVDPTLDNMLKVTTDLTKAALSMRLMGEDSEATSSKLHECAWNTYKIWEATQPVKGVQLIFCDFSTPKPDRYNVYAYIKALLVALGVPVNQIEFIHDHDKGKRKALFERVNAGEVRVLLGSTEKLGTGCNVHRGGLWAMHHLDAPWRPADIEQREGRGVRQGNGELLSKKLKNVTVCRYITERLDALRWQTLQWKQAMISKYKEGQTLNSIEDCDEPSYSYAQVKSLATGNPLLIEESKLRNELNSLLIQKRAHERTQFDLKWAIERWEKRIVSTNFEIDVCGRIASDCAKALVCEESRKSFNKAIQGKLSKMKKNAVYSPTEITAYRGFNLVATCSVNDLNTVFTKLVLDDITIVFPVSTNNEVIKFSQSNPLDSIDRALSLISSNSYKEQLQNQLSSQQVELERCKNQQSLAFTAETRIIEVERRLAEIDALMTAVQVSLLVDEENADQAKSDDEETLNEFWLACDRSINEVTITNNIVQFLLSRNDNPQWLTEIEDGVAEYGIKPQTDTVSEQPKGYVALVSSNNIVPKVSDLEIPEPSKINQVKEEINSIKAKSSFRHTQAIQLSLFDLIAS